MINSMAAFGSFNDGPSVHDRVAELEAENKKLREALDKCAMFKLQPNTIQQIVNRTQAEINK